MTVGAFDDSFTETLTVKRKTAHTAAGDVTRGTTTTMAARIERGEGTLQLADGTELRYEARVFTAAALQLQDLLFFPEDSTSGQEAGRRPMRVEPMRELDGTVSHWETYL